MTQYSTDSMIEEMLAALDEGRMSARQKHLYRESLRALVRLAKSEQLQEMRADLRKATSAPLPDLHHYDETK